MKAGPSRWAQLLLTLTGLYLTYGVLGGIGTGIVYVGIVGLMVAWFPDKRGRPASSRPVTEWAP